MVLTSATAAVGTTVSCRGLVCAVSPKCSRTVRGGRSSVALSKVISVKFCTHWGPERRQPERARMFLAGSWSAQGPKSTGPGCTVVPETRMRSKKVSPVSIRSGFRLAVAVAWAAS